jgi:tetratricopeptide (TPR) repeat protein
LRPTEWRTILAKLRRARLLSQEDPHNPGQLDTHPLVREYFGKQFRTQQTNAWKECNRRLFHYLCIALRGQFRFTLITDKLSAARQIAERLYSLAHEQDDPTLMIGAYRASAASHYYLGDFESARQYAMHGVQIWRSGNVQSYAEDYLMPAVRCLIFGAMSEWHFGEIASSQANMDEAISIAKELKDMNALAAALNWAAALAYHERNHAEVDRLTSDLIELCTPHNFLHFLAIGAIYRGWARSASGDTAEGIP